LKNRIHRLFWTELGRRALGEEPAADAGRFPPPMAEALDSDHHLPRERLVELGESLRPRKARYIYGLCWSALSRIGGFERPMRLQPFPGVTLLIPFAASRTGVLPQSMSRRIPRLDRAHALVGKSCAALRAGMALLVVLGVRSVEVEEVLERGFVSVCTLDHLARAVDSMERGRETEPTAR
jgi:hypothetical protein